MHWELPPDDARRTDAVSAPRLSGDAAVGAALAANEKVVHHAAFAEGTW